ncbi:PspC domain-containing protein [Nocardia puris]|nr:PspC domain-containing protein [Nocardia puris]
MTRTSFGEQLQQMWHTRPVRLSRHGPIAGVAAGFGQRYNVDPVLVRVAFVVSTFFGGAGIVLYLLAWLLFNEAGDRSSAAESLFGRGQSSQSQTKTVVLMVALAIALTTVGPIGVGLAGSGMISLALMLAGWWMLFMRCPQPPPGTSAADLGFADGLAATGYPGAVFPTGPVRSAGYYPDTMYTPYTKLPDAYVPAPHVPVDQPTDVLRTSSPDASAGSASPASSSQAAATVSEAAVSSSSPRSFPLTEPASAGSSSEFTKSEPGAADPASVASPRSDAAKAPTSLTKEPSVDKPVSVFADRTPPSWDPLGVAPLAWDLPEPTPTHTVVAPPPKRPRSRFTPVVLGLAILAAAGAGAIAAAGAEWMTASRIAAVALAVVGFGLVLGAFLRRGYGLLVVTAPLAGFVLLASMVGPIEFDRTTMGEQLWTPATMADLQDEYRVTMGSGTLDLRSLNLTENRAVTVDVHLGEGRVLVPEGMTVRADCTANMGDALCPEGVVGPNTPGAPVLDLDMNVRMGSVEVRHG